MATVEQIMDALAGQISAELSPVITNLQVDGKMIPSPTPPTIDIYPGDPFMERASMGGHFDFFFSVRARVLTADHESGQALLLSLMDPDATYSLTSAIESDPTLGSLVNDVVVIEGPSGYGIFSDPGSIDNRLLGAIWRTQVIP